MSAFDEPRARWEDVGVRVGRLAPSVIAALALALACGGKTELRDDDGFSGGGAGGSSAGGSSSGGSPASGGSSMGRGGRGGRGGSSAGGSSAGGSSAGGSSAGGSSSTSFDCNTLCALEYPPGCGLSTANWQDECPSGCRDIELRTPPECRSLLDPIGDCVARAFAACQEPEICEPHVEAWTRCATNTDPCFGAGGFGVSGDTFSLEGHLNVCGCRSGRLAGSPCSSAFECEEHCCGCQGNGVYSVQGCVDGFCAPADLACRLAFDGVCPLN
jgi:hypothetical protein